jgi:hypothetical protein
MHVDATMLADRPISDVRLYETSPRNSLRELKSSFVTVSQPCCLKKKRVPQFQFRITIELPVVAYTRCISLRG